MSAPIIIDARVGDVRLEISIRVVEGEARVRAAYDERQGNRPPANAPRQEPRQAAPASGNRPAGGGGQRPSIIPELNALREELGLDNGAGANAIAEVTGTTSRLVDIEAWLADDPGRTLRDLCELAADILDRKPMRGGRQGGGYGGRR